ncbi:MAG: hypothetical protein K0U98_08190 [Deltaproteobacteria bacterium]|nr:hypothetical protein [Deltaproteobacteria bacterium]
MAKQSFTASREEPFPASWTVEQGLRAFFEENGFEREAYDGSRTPASVLGFEFSVPNPPRHRWAIMLHDLHHIATGFGTDLTGEGEISAWEFRRGLRPLGLYVGSIVFGGVLLGLVVAPRRTLRAWRSSLGGPSLFFLGSYSFDDLLQLSIGELRRILGLREEGLSKAHRGVHSRAPKP